MNNTIRINRINALKSQGFTMLKGFSKYYINENGTIIDLNTNKPIKLTKNKYFDLVNSKGVKQRFNAAKLILQQYSNIPYNNRQHVTFLDKNPKNLNISNLTYQTITDDLKAFDNYKLMQIIRFNFNVSNKFKISNLWQTNQYLSVIATKSGFIAMNNKTKYIELFIDHLNINNALNTYKGLSLIELSKKYNLSVRDCSKIIKNFKYKLIDFENQNGKNEILPFLTTKRERKTKAINEWNLLKKDLKID